MRYPEGHKQATKNRIVETAAKLFRTKGFNGIGIDGLMEEANLTRGGFYGYFRSKRELLSAVCEYRHDFIERLKARKGNNTKALAKEGLTVAEAYVDVKNNKAVLSGCSLAALAIDCARGDAVNQKAYAEGVKQLASEFERGLNNPKSLDSRALQAIALCVGSLLIQNAAAADKALAAKMSASTKAALRGILK